MSMIHNWFDFKGAWGSPTLVWSKSSFLLFLIEGSPSYQILFTGSKNIDPSQSYRISNREFTCNYSSRANFKFNRESRFAENKKFGHEKANS